MVGEHELELFETILDAMDRLEEIPLSAWRTGVTLYTQSRAYDKNWDFSWICARLADIKSQKSIQMIEELFNTDQIYQTSGMVNDVHLLSQLIDILPTHLHDKISKLYRAPVYSDVTDAVAVKTLTGAQYIDFKVSIIQKEK